MAKFHKYMNLHTKFNINLFIGCWDNCNEIWTDRMTDGQGDSNISQNKWGIISLNTVFYHIWHLEEWITFTGVKYAE